MKKIDHLNLAKFWMSVAGGNLPEEYQLAFIFGNIEPDINFLTYLHGFRTQKKFHGHNYENVMPVLIKMIERNMGKPLTLHRCYCIGKCFHYAADCFTFPHNKAFTGTVKEHLLYEEELHMCWLNAKKKRIPSIYPYRSSSSDVCKELEQLHSKYLSEPHVPENDRKYILMVTQLLLETCLLPQGKEASNESVNNYRLV